MEFCLNANWQQHDLKINLHFSEELSYKTGLSIVLCTVFDKHQFGDCQK